MDSPHNGNVSLWILRQLDRLLPVHPFLEKPVEIDESSLSSGPIETVQEIWVYDFRFIICRSCDGYIAMSYFPYNQ